MSGVTVSRCVECDRELIGRRRHTRTCSDACRQRAYRRAKARRAAAEAKSSSAIRTEDFQRPEELSFEQRAYLRQELNLLARERVKRQRAADRALFDEQEAA